MVAECFSEQNADAPKLVSRKRRYLNQARRSDSHPRIWFAENRWIGRRRIRDISQPTAAMRQSTQHVQSEDFLRLIRY